MTKLEYWVARAEQNLDCALKNASRAPCVALFICHKKGTAYKEDKEITKAIIDRVIKPKDLDYKIVPSVLDNNSEILMAVINRDLWEKDTKKGFYPNARNEL